MLENKNGQKRRVVITGIGAVSPIGNSVDECWESLMNKKSGIAAISKFDASKITSQIAGEVKGLNENDYTSKKERRNNAQFVSYALAASQMAVEDAKLTIDPSEAHRAAVIVGSGIGGLELIEEQALINHSKGPRRISPFFIPGSIINMAPAKIAIRYGARGPNYSVVTACAAGTHSIGEAFRQIQWGASDVAITGGAESAITQLAVGGFCSMRALSTRNDDPERASRPFEKDRDGFVIAEGAGILILESLDHALERGAKIYAEVIGFGMSGDAHHITAPNVEGPRICLQATIDDAGLNPEDVDYINAHGTSTPLNDANETDAIKTVFGEHAYKLAISSTKSMTGHLLGAAGGLEAIFTALSLKNGFIPPTLNYNTADPACDLDYVPNEPRFVDINIAVSNSFGFGGTNASIALKKYSQNGAGA